MNDEQRYRSASDRDIFDLLMSSKGRMTEKALLGIGLKRGIIYSHKTPRERLVNDISLLTHDYTALKDLIEKREAHARSDKRAYVTLPVSLSKQEIETIVQTYKKEFKDSEKVTAQLRRAKDVVVNVAYEDVDYSKTYLIQRQPRDACIEFVTGANSTIIRMPATEKARIIVERFRKEVSRLKVQNIESAEPSLHELLPQQRTDFFISLMRELVDYDLQTVVTVRCATQDDDGELNDDDVEEVASAEIVGKINAAALSGVNILQSEEYQALTGKGFFITAVTWHSQQRTKPYDLFQFSASFENPREGRGFKFDARIAKRLVDGSVTSQFKPLEVTRQPVVWSAVEKASMEAFEKVKLAAASSRTAQLSGANE